MLICFTYILPPECRHLLESGWGKEELMLADGVALRRGKKFIIVVLKDNLSINEFPRELRHCLRSYSYIDATKNTDLVMQSLRYVLCKNF